MTNRVVTLELHSEYCGNCAVCAGRQVGVNDERERIIKLLEPLAIHAPNCFYEQHNWPEDCDANAVRKVIALIKGDN